MTYTIANFTDSSETSFDKALTEQVVKTLQTNLRGTLPHLELCGKAKFVKGSNNTLRFLSIPDMDVVTGTPTPGVAPWLTEGVTPDHEVLEFAYEEFSANQAGRLVGLTDIAMETHPVDLFNTAVERVTRNVAATTDKRISDVILAGTNVVYAGTGNVATADVDTTDLVTGTLLRRAVAGLKVDEVPAFEGGYYRALINPAVVFDIESDDAVGGWLDANKYAGSMALMSGEIGKYAGIRFIESTNAGMKAGQGTGSIDVYSTLIAGQGAFVFGDWGTINVYTTAPGGAGDELHQRASVGWKAKFGAKIVLGQGPRYVRIESASGL